MGYGCSANGFVGYELVVMMVLGWSWDGYGFYGFVYVLDALGLLTIVGWRTKVWSIGLGIER